ncbi:MAG: hypothetical protein AAGG81_04225, partial [Chlamydiota bacterium]
FVNKRDAYLTLPGYSTDEISISLEGAVESANTIRVKKGTKFKEVIQKAGVLEGADLSTFEMEKSLKSDQLIIVPSKKMLTIFLEGDVSPRGKFTIEAGSSLHDLYQQLGKTPLTNNRKLMNEEVLKF